MSFFFVFIINLAQMYIIQKAINPEEIGEINQLITIFIIRLQFNYSIPIPIIPAPNIAPITV